MPGDYYNPVVYSDGSGGGKINGALSFGGPQPIKIFYGPSPPTSTSYPYIRSDGSGNLYVLCADGMSVYCGGWDNNGSGTVTFGGGGLTSVLNGAGILRYRSINTVGAGVAAIYGLDNRTGLTAADATAVTLYAVPAAGGLFRISGSLDCTAYTSGTGTYTLTWTDVNGTAHTRVASLSAVGHADINALGLERVEGGTNITAQLTGTFVATFDTAMVVEQVA